jgi:hypothetical protein
MAFPIQRKNDRSFSPEWQGEVFVCDIDRTYLATRFSSLKGLARIPFEFAIDKQDIEGMVPLLKEIRRGPGAKSRLTPLYFISASPVQLRPVLERKMLLDGLEFDGTTFKDWIRSVVGLRVGRLREQLGFKLTALLSGRAELPGRAEEILIGDDLEQDPLAFSLYADLVSGRIEENTFYSLLTSFGVASDDAGEILAIARRLPRGSFVKRAYIRLERFTSADPFLEFFPHVIACRGAFQMAVHLWRSGSISVEGAVRISQELLRRGASPESLGDRLLEACKKGCLDPTESDELIKSLTDRAIVPKGLSLPETDARWKGGPFGDQHLPWTPKRYFSESGSS